MIVQHRLNIIFYELRDYRTVSIKEKCVKKGLLISLIFALTIPLIAQNGKEKDDGVDVIPILNYNILSLDKRVVHVTGGGMAVMVGEMEPETVEETDNLLAVGLYGCHILKDRPIFDYPDSYHSIEIILQRKVQRHQYYALFQSYSDMPITGGLHTFAFVSGYGFEFIHNNGHSLALGASLGITDWGIEFPDGGAWPVLPLPFVHYEFTSQWFDFSFDFTTSPMLDFIIAPEQKLRFNGSFMLTNLDVKSPRDLKFDASLEYRFFSDDSPIGDFAGVRTGVLGEDYGYDLGGNDNKSLQVSWYAVYGTLDLSFLEITGGYAFTGQERYGDGCTNELGDGFYFKVQLAYLF